MNIAIIVVGVLLVVLLNKVLANHYKKARQLSDRDAQMKGLKVMLFSLAGVIALDVVVSTVLPSLRVAIQANRYKSHAQTVDINEFLPDDLKTAPAVWKVTDKKLGNRVYLMGSIHGGKIYDELSDATYRSAKDFLMSRGLYFEYFDDYNADFWYSLVYEAVVSGIKNIDYTKGVDQYYIELAQKDGK